MDKPHITIAMLGNDRIDRIQHPHFRPNRMRVPKPTDTDDVAYTEADRAAYLESIKETPQ